MPANPDLILVETVRTHRSRMLSALVHGELARRRLVNEQAKRLLGGTALATVGAAGCIGFALVRQLMETRT